MKLSSSSLIKTIIKSIKQTVKTPVRYFQLRVVPKDGKTIKPTKFVIHYSTHANIGKVNPGETWTYKNVGDFSYFNNEKIAERGSDSHSYKKRVNWLNKLV